MNGSQLAGVSQAVKNSGPGRTTEGAYEVAGVLVLPLALANATVGHEPIEHLRRDSAFPETKIPGLTPKTLAIDKRMTCQIVMKVFSFARTSCATSGGTMAPA